MPALFASRNSCCGTCRICSALAAICVTRQPSRDDPPRRHQQLVEALVTGTQAEAAEAIRQHIAVGMQHTLEQLQPYFQLRTANGETFFRSEKKRQQHAVR